MSDTNRISTHSNNNFDLADSLSPPKATNSPNKQRSITVDQQPQKSQNNIFLTDFNQQEGGLWDDINGNHRALNDKIQNLNKTLMGVLKQHENEFLFAYKEQMFNIQKELKTLKNKIDEETLKRKKDERMNILEQERDWFRSEAIRLDKICKDQQKLMQEVRFRMKILNDDKHHLEGLVLSLKKENKSLKQDLLGNSQFEKPQPSPARKSQSSSSRRVQKIATDELIQNAHKTVQSPKPYQIPAYELIKDSSQGSIRPKEVDDSLNSPDQHRVIDIQDDTKHIEIINQLKHDLDKERRSLRVLKAERSQETMKKYEYEKIFVACMNEVKKDISRRRQQQNARQRKGGQRDPQIPPEVDFGKFSSTDKRKLLEFFMGNEMIIHDLYTLVFSQNQTGSVSTMASPKDKLMGSLQGQAFNTMKSDSKLKYSFQSGFPDKSYSQKNLPVVNADFGGVSLNPKAQYLMGELNRDQNRKKL